MKVVGSIPTLGQYSCYIIQYKYFISQQNKYLKKWDNICDVGYIIFFSLKNMK